MDSTIIREIPPLYHGWAPIGEQAVVPITGNHAKRVLSGVLNILSGQCLMDVTRRFRQGEFQSLLRQIRRCWRGWQIVLFLDRHGAHVAPGTRRLAKALHIELRFLPTACPELNVMDTLWRKAKAEALANEPTPDVDDSVAAAITFIRDLSAAQRLRKAGVHSRNFWLADVLAARVSKNYPGPT
jgi:transposase